MDIPVIIVGAGQAGVALSYHLQRADIDHLVIERDRAFSAWYQRWDSFHLNTANWMNRLPGFERPFVPGAPDYGLAQKAQALAYFQAYLRFVDPPLLQATVTGVEADGDFWHVHTRGGDTLRSRCVVLCNGAHHCPYVPPLAADCASQVKQWHSQHYRNPQQIDSGRVLIVGSGSSGVQIALDLARAGSFEICLSRGSSGHFPWHVLGIPIHFFARSFGFFDIPVDSRRGRWLLRLNRGGDPATPPSPRQLQRHWGVRVLTRLAGIKGEYLIFDDGARMVQQDLTILWCTGYRFDCSLLPAALRHAAAQGKPWHKQGVGRMPGLYLLGQRYQRILGSHLIYGVGRDAMHIARAVEGYLEK